MKERRKTLYVFLVIALLLNLVFPPTMVSAFDGLLDDSSNSLAQSVTAATYGNAPSVTKATYGEIQENIITDVKILDADGKEIETVRPDVGSKVKVNYTWELEDNHKYGEGSTFTFDLPKQFRVSNQIGPSDLVGGVGQYIVTPQGKVIFTFNEEINNGRGYTGDFFVERWFEEQQLGGGTQEKIVFPIRENKQKEVLVHFKPKSSTDIKKSGWTTKSMNPLDINWEVVMNTGEKEIKNAVFTDEIPTGLMLDEGSVQVEKLRILLNGQVAKDGHELIDVTGKLKTTANTIELELGDIKAAYRVTYKTDIIDLTDKQYTNNAQLTGSVDNKTVTYSDRADVNVKFSKPLAKKAIANEYDPKTQTVTWQIEFNYNERKIPQAKALIEDVFSSSQQLVDGSFEVVQVDIDNNGKGVNPKPVAGTKYEVKSDSANNKFTLQFKQDIEHAYRIIYNTKAKDRVYDNSVIVENNVTYDNETVGDKQTIGQVIFHKYGHQDEVDYKDKKMKWSINLNEDNRPMQEVKIHDNFVGQGLTFIENSLTIPGLDASKGDYSVILDKTANEGFIIDFHVPINKQYVISYWTEFDPKLKKSEYVNTATLTWKENNKVQKPIEKEATIIPDSYTTRNGKKFGKYDAANKEITWTVDINYNLHTIQQAIVRDVYTGQQKFDPKNVIVRYLSLTGGVDGVTETGAPLEQNTDYTVKTIKEDDKGGEIEFVFLKPINSAYRIQYKTSLEQYQVLNQYVNTATLYDSDTTKAPLFQDKATVSPNHGGVYVSKGGYQGTGAQSDIAFWKVRINESQSEIDAGAVLTDTLSANQKLLKNTIELYTTNVNTSGDLTESTLADTADYELLSPTEATSNVIQIKFKKNLNRAYILKYQSYIDAENKDMISNDVVIEGTSTTNGKESTDEKLKVEFANAGGGAVPKGRGKIIVNKVDGTGNALQGAAFGLYNATGDVLIRGPITNDSSNPTIVFDNIPYKDYVLKELSAPAGYLLDKKYAVGEIIRLREAEKTVKVVNHKIVRDYELTKVSTAIPSEKLEGAVFKLQIKDGTVVDGFKDVDGKTELVTNGKGIIHLSDLPPGDYKIFETKAPQGYQLDATPIYFTIDADQIVLKSGEARNTPLPGSITVTKKDAASGALLSGAEFVLKDAKGNIIATKQTVADGILNFDNLKSGTYYLVEKTAPDGYVLNTQPITVEVKNGTDTPVTVLNKLVPGSVKVIKVAAGTNTILPGAEFRIFDAHKQPAKDHTGKELTQLVTDEHGQLIITNLNPGQYFAQETKAPVGYLLNGDLFEFTVSKKAVAEVKVPNTREPEVPKTGTARLVKVDAASEERKLPGAEFRLLDANKQPVKDQAGLELPLLITNEHGEVTIPNLYPGKYYAEETKAPVGYVLNTELIEFDVNAGKEAVVMVRNILDLPPTGSVKLIKIAYENKEKKLSGAKFRLLDEEKQPVKDEAGAELPILTTDTNGEAFLPALKPGKYFFEETEAPSGYIRNTTWIGFEITRGQLTVVTVENVRYTDGGGKTDPYKPWEPSKPGDKTPPKTDPNIPTIPGQIVDPTDPKTPTTPTNPGTTTDPDRPTVPGETTDLDTGDTTEPGGSKGNPDGNKDDEGNPDDADLGGKTDSKKPNPKPGGKLPQTGEEAPVSPIVGMILITAAALMWIARKRLFVRR
ncbi:SpaA isopeptide-forming pilin-related protein [Paenibacillus alvei]|uniref:Gram-positive cocci surface proteins LPxTG domain-containing protein n=1 Tax=Paenibacillus alvei TaxID=44250 RepID=A0A383RKZ4_PAEAL|nr:SpaA isopeptide-forming pilin-related protein [Paenibacillus alvei]SYX87262.1 conserved exported protein of unknown function [Paenibacillus alvei]